MYAHTHTRNQAPQATQLGIVQASFVAQCSNHTFDIAHLKGGVDALTHGSSTPLFKALFKGSVD